MAQNDFVLEDVRDFLLSELNIKWDFEIYDEKLKQYRTANLNDFKEKKITKFKVKRVLAKEVSIILYDDVFEIFDTVNLSKEWKKYKNKLNKSNSNLNI